MSLTPKTLLMSLSQILTRRTKSLRNDLSISLWITFIIIMILNRKITQITSRLYLPTLNTLQSIPIQQLHFAFSKQSDLEKISKNIKDP
jgi:hypothetical protein